jgi:hypothetical protein
MFPNIGCLGKEHEMGVIIETKDMPDIQVQDILSSVYRLSVNAMTLIEILNRGYYQDRSAHDPGTEKGKANIIFDFPRGVVLSQLVEDNLEEVIQLLDGRRED